MFGARGKALVIGALVADAASVGLHWIYDQKHVRKIAPETPEFVAPDSAHFSGVPAYFAHGSRAVGQISHYGAQSLVMLDALTAQNGAFVPATFAERFRAYFGYGGGWVGYIDNAIRETLNNILRSEDAAITAAQSIPFDGDPRLAKAFALKALALSGQHEGSARVDAIAEAVRHEDPAVTAFGERVINAVLGQDRRFGAHDEQMSASAKLPPLIAALSAHSVKPDSAAFFAAIDTAVRATNDHPRALTYSRCCAAMMAAALETDDLEAIVAAGEAMLDPETLQPVLEAKELLDQDTETVTAQFGMACDLKQGVPSVVHTILTAPNFTTAVRRNIWSGGDSCGRAIILGAILGAAYGLGGDKGIPEAWVNTLRTDPATADLLDRL